MARYVLVSDYRLHSNVHITYIPVKITTACNLMYMNFSNECTCMCAFRLPCVN